MAVAVTAVTAAAATVAAVVAVVAVVVAVAVCDNSLVGSKKSAAIVSAGAAHTYQCCRQQEKMLSSMQQMPQ